MYDGKRDKEIYFLLYMRWERPQGQKNPPWWGSVNSLLILHSNVHSSKTSWNWDLLCRYSNTRIFTNIIKFHQIRLKDSYWTFSGNFVIFFYLTITWLLDSFIMHLKSWIFTLSDEVKNKQKVFHANITTLETSKWARLFSFHKNSFVAFTQKNLF